MTTAFGGTPARFRVVAPSVVVAVIVLLILSFGALHFYAGDKGMAIAVGGVIAVAVFVAALVSPAVACGLLSVVVFTRLFAIAGSDRLAPGVLAVVLGLTALIASRRRGAPDAVMIYLGLAGSYLAFSALSSLWSSDATIVLGTTRTLGIQMLVGLGVVACVSNIRHLRWAMWGLIIAGFVVGLLAIRQYATNDYSSDDFGLARASIEQIVGNKSAHRSGGPVGDANFFGQMMVVVVAAAMERFRAARSWGARMFAGLTVLVALYTIVITYSRGTLVALIAGAILAFIHSRHRIRTVVVGIVIVLLATLVLPQGYVARLTRLNSASSLGQSSSGPNDPAIAGRSSSWIVASRMIEKNPIGGIGFGTFEAHYLDYSRHVGLDTRGLNRNAHSYPLQLFAEQGLLGLGVMVIVLIGAFAAIARSRRGFRRAGDRSGGEDDDAMSVLSGIRDMLIVYLVASIFLHAAYPQLLWLLIGLAYAARQCVPGGPRPSAESLDDRELVSSGR